MFWHPYINNSKDFLCLNQYQHNQIQEQDYVRMDCLRPHARYAAEEVCPEEPMINLQQNLLNRMNGRLWNAMLSDLQWKLMQPELKMQKIFSKNK